MDDETQLQPVQGAAGGAPFNRDHRHDPGVIEGQVAGREAGATSPDRDDQSPQDAHSQSAAVPAQSLSWRALAAGGLGGVAAAAIVVAAYWAFAPRSEDGRGLVDRIAALESSAHEAVSAAASLNKRVSVIETALQGQTATLNAADAAIARLGSDTSALRGGAEDARGDLSALTARVGKLENASATQVNSAQTSGTDIAPLAARLAKVEAVVGGLESKPSPGADAERSAMTARLAAVEAALVAPKSEARADALASARADNSLAIAVIAESLEERLAAGAPFQWEVSALERLGAPAPSMAALKPLSASGAPTTATLARTFAEIEPDVLAAAAPADDSGIFDRFLSHLRGLVRVRTLNERPGDDPQARVSQIGAAAARGDLATAIGLISRLPDAARQRAKDWVAQAEARQAADVALQGIRGVALAHVAGMAN